MENYIQQKVLGKGSFGSAWLVQRRRDHQYFVAKEVRLAGMKPADREAAKHEIQMLRQLDHANITRYVDHFEHRGSLFIVMEYANGGDLYTKIKSRRGVRFSEKDVLNYFCQLTLALAHMHDKRILHRDLKSQNVFLTQEGIVKLGDFGISTVLRNTYELKRTVCGTPYYFSPELCQNKPYNNKSDVWAMGCILYELTTLNHAFDGNNLKALTQRILRGVYPPIHCSYSKDLSGLIAGMLALDPMKRPNVHQILNMGFIRAHLASLHSAATKQPSAAAAVALPQQPQNAAQALQMQQQQQRLVDPEEKLRAQREAQQRAREEYQRQLAEKEKKEKEAAQRAADAKLREEQKQKAAANRLAEMKKRMEEQVKEHEEKLRRIREQADRDKERQRQLDAQRKQELEEKNRKQEAERRERMRLAAQYAAQNRAKEQAWDHGIKQAVEEAQKQPEQYQQQQQPVPDRPMASPYQPADARQAFLDQRREAEANRLRAKQDDPYKPSAQLQQQMQHNDHQYAPPRQQQPQLTEQQRAEAFREQRRQAELNRQRAKQDDPYKPSEGGWEYPPQQQQQQQPAPQQQQQRQHREMTAEERAEVYRQQRREAEANRLRAKQDDPYKPSSAPPSSAMGDKAHSAELPQPEGGGGYPQRPNNGRAATPQDEAEARRNAYFEMRREAEANKRRLMGLDPNPSGAPQAKDQQQMLQQQHMRRNSEPEEPMALPPQPQRRPSNSPENNNNNNLPPPHQQQQHRGGEIQPPGVAAMRYMQERRQQEEQERQQHQQMMQQQQQQMAEQQQLEQQRQQQQQRQEEEVVVSASDDDDQDDQDGDAGLHRFLNSEAAAVPEEDNDAKENEDFTKMAGNIADVLNQGAMMGEDFGEEGGGDYDPDKFFLDGQTLRLPNCNVGDPLGSRIEALRMFLENSLGDEMFLRVYRAVTTLPQPGEEAVTSMDDETDEMDQLRAEMPPELHKYLPTVTQLVACEQFFYMRGN